MADDIAKRVLILDDSEIVLQLVTAQLEAEGVAVLAASTLEAFENHLAAGGFDLVLLDVEMPEMYGDDIGSVLRAVRGIDVPIHLFSSVPPDELAKRAGEAEVDGFISKEDGMDALVARVREILRM